MSNEPLTSPGILNMQCMIWEPNPISQRTAQDYTVVYNATTIKSLPDNIQKLLRHFDNPPYGIFLKEKYVYRDTFLKLGDEFLQSNRTDMRAENGDDLYNTSGDPNYPYIIHQTFNLNGSLFSPNVITETGIEQATTEAIDNSLSKWRYDERQVPFEHDGHVYGEDGDSSNNHDYVSAITMQTNNVDFEDTLRAYTGADLTPIDINYIIARKSRRFMPLQIATSSEQKGRSGNDNDTSVPIHWLCTKQTPLYSQEDFFVEFVRFAYQHDIVTASQSMQTQYQTLDTTYLNTTQGAPIVNGGVVDLNADGTVNKETINTYNLSNQPYYLIEMGIGDPKHHYFIILAYNAYPIFVHVGVAATLVPQGNGQAPKVIQSKVDISRKLSTYSDVSCKQLMDTESLRVTVRAHLGNLIITFSGYEGTPWLISRTDFQGQTTESSSSSSSSSTDCGADLLNVQTTNIAIEIAATPIQIGGGNLKSGFLFGPLHYQPEVSFPLPNAITVKGPVDDTDINMYLSERGQSGDKLIYFCDAENYIETYQGAAVGTEKTDTDYIWPIKSDSKNTSAGTVPPSTSDNPDDIRNQNQEKISYISITKATALGSSPNPPPTSSDPTGDPGPGSCNSSTSSGGNTQTQSPQPADVGDYIKWFTGQFTLSSGDGIISAAPAVGNGPATPYWRIVNGITPIALGWRLNVPPDDNGHDQTPVDVAAHVESFSHNWSYTDNAKVEHTGNIRFRVNLGTATFFANQTTPPTQTGDPSSSSSGAVDRSAYIQALADKTFFIRVYAWWSGGYMDCINNTCPCRKPGGANSPIQGIPANAKFCIFTGLCHGGEITIEGNSRYMDCQLYDYMKIMQDQYFLNSPFFDGMNDYFAIGLISYMAGFTEDPLGDDPYAPAMLINQMAAQSLTINPNPSNPPSNNPPNSNDWVLPYSLTGESIYCSLYTLPSSYDILQNPFMKFADASKYDEALTKIGTMAGKVAYFDRFGVLRYDVRPDARFKSALGKASRKPKCNFMASPYALGRNQNCNMLDLMALTQYSYKRAAGDVVNDILLVTATPQGEVLVKSVVNLPGRYDATTPGFVGYTKRLLQIDGIFGSQTALESIANYYADIVFKPPVVVNWEAMGVPHLQAMDVVTFTGLNDDLGFPPDNVELGNGTPPPIPSLTLVITSLSGEINPSRNEWRNKYEGEWLYGTV